MPGSLARAILLVALTVAASPSLSPSSALESPDLWLEAEQALAEGRWAEARLALSSFVARYPQSPHIPQALLSLARVEPDAATARAHLERLRAEHPRTEFGAEAMLLLAQADLAAGVLEEIPGRLRSLGDDKHPPQLRRRALLVVAEIERRLGKLDDAARDFQRVMELGPTDLETARALYGLAGAAHARRDRAEEERYLAECFQRFPEGDLAPAALWQWALSLRDQGLESEAKAKLLLLERRFPGSAEALAAREGRAAMATARAAGAPAAENEAPAEEPTIPAEETGAHSVRSGIFPTWEEADSLREDLASRSPVALHVVPGKDREGPYAVEAGVFSTLADAVRFAAWVEAETGFRAAIVSPDSSRLAP